MNSIKYLIPVALIIGLYFYFTITSGSNIPQAYIGNEIEDILLSSDLDADFYHFTESNGFLVDTTLDRSSRIEANSVLLSKSNKGAIEIGVENLDELKTSNLYQLKVFIDEGLSDKIKIDPDTINIVLDALNSGVQIDTVNFSTNEFSGDTVITNGKINVNKIYEKLKVDSSDYIHVYLFEDSQFFNTANAVSLKSIDDDRDDLVVILGNAYLLESPYLFAHELFHGLGLTHHNEVYESCDSISNSNRFQVFNVMNESNIGCSRRLSARQIMMLNSDSYFPKLKKDIRFPEDGTCNCNYEGLGGEVERYLNSFDRNIDDTPLVGDDEAFLKKISDLGGNIFPDDIKNVIRGNYEAESLELFGNVLSNYVDDRLEVHEKLRMYNLCRWLKENAEINGDSMVTNFWKLNPDSLIINMVEYYTEAQKEFCIFKCGGNQNTCESQVFNCDTCSEDLEKIRYSKEVRRDSTNGQDVIFNMADLSSLSNEENYFGAIVANYFKKDSARLNSLYGIEFNKKALLPKGGSSQNAPIGQSKPSKSYKKQIKKPQPNKSNKQNKQ
jgi:hypothetical protein